MADRRKHWGWGLEYEERFDEEPDARPRPACARTSASGAEDVEAPAAPRPARAAGPVPAELQGLRARTDAYDRARYGLGPLLPRHVRGMRGEIAYPPDFVVHAWTEDHVIAHARVGRGEGRVCDAGGRRDERRRRRRGAAAIALHLGRDGPRARGRPVSRAARIQAGATGPRLEEQLAEHGLTLRFFPQSFELSTLGGWIATRAGGHFATGPTHIDDLVEGVRAITPGAGVWQSRRLPGSGAGPSPDRMLLGSEGTLGVITEAWVRVQPKPARPDAAGARVRQYARAAAAVREIVQAGLRPANCRLLSAGEARLTFAGRHRAAGPGLRGRHRRRRRARAAIARRARGDERQRRIGRLARRLPARALPARHVRRDRACWRRPSRPPSPGTSTTRSSTTCAGPRRPCCASAAAPGGHGAPDPRLRGRRGALLHVPGAGRARRGGRDLGGGQARGVRGDHPRRRDDHPPPRRRPRPPALVRPPAAGCVRRRAARRRRPRSTRRGS